MNITIFQYRHRWDIAKVTYSKYIALALILYYSPELYSQLFCHWKQYTDLLMGTTLTHKVHRCIRRP